MKILALWVALLAAPLSGDDVQRLLEQLDSPKLAEREAAEQALQAAGPGILDRLPGSDPPLSPETELRIARIKNVLEQQMAVDWVKPTRVLLKQAQMPLDKLLQAIERQTGNQVAMTKITGTKITGTKITGTKKTGKRPINCQKLNRRTFWETVRSLAEQNDLKIVTRPGHRCVELVPRQKETASAQLEPIGPFLLVIDEKKGFQQEIEIAWEPRLKPIWLKLHLDGPDGTSAGTYELNPTTDTISAQLTVPAPNLPPEATLSGKITGLIPGPKRSFRFPLTESGNRKKRFAQVALELLNVRIEGSEVRLALRLRYTQTYDALESYRGWFFDNEAHLIPSNPKPAKDSEPPKPLDPTSTQTDNRTANSIDLIYRFKIDGPANDYTFTYRTPIALLHIDYHFPKPR